MFKLLVMTRRKEYIILQMPLKKIIKKINNLFLGMGFDEIVTSSFVGDAMYKEFMVDYDNKKIMVKYDKDTL